MINDKFTQYNTKAAKPYIQTELRIEEANEETGGNIIADTYGWLKKVLRDDPGTVDRAVGFDYNVTSAYIQTINDPSMSIEHNNTRYYMHSSVGNLHPVDADGNPTSGLFTMHLLG